MKIEPKLMTDAELADFALTVERAFAEQSLAGLEMNYDAMANAGPLVLGHIAALTADYQRLGSVVDAHGRLLAALTTDRDAHAERCVELQRQLTEMEEGRDGYRAALARHEERVVEQVAAFVEATDINRWRLATLIRSHAWRKEFNR